MKTILVSCLAHRHTGGLTLAHQLCAELVNQGFNAKMYYYFGCGQKKSNPVNPNYEKYGLSYVTKLEDNEETIIVVPETNVNILRKIHKAKRVIWWMSVDNYFKTLRSRRYKVEDLYGLRRFDFKQKDILHLAQSYYAIDFLKKSGVVEENIKYLSDYLDSEFLDNANKYMNCSKKDVVLYNPKKGWDFTKKIIDNSTDIEWLALENLTPSEMKDKLGTSKVYIDFGNHPGKDRIPREAAIMGCCVITGRRGSANYYNDVPIQDKYKYDENTCSIRSIYDLICDCIYNYDCHRKDFEGYIEYIRNEREQFIIDVKEIFSELLQGRQ